jgi:hypothetical protein
MNEDEKEQLRNLLLHGNLDEADAAMSRLLDIAKAEELDPRDLVASLEAMERLGEPGQARMFEPFVLFASRFPEVSVPVLTERLRRSPLSWTGRLSAAVIHEVLQNVPGGRAHVDREAVVSALSDAVDAAARGCVDSAQEAITTLHDWATREPLPEIGPAIVRLLMRAADKESPKEDVLRLAREILELNGQAALLSQVRERAQLLPSDHPLRRAIHPCPLPEI